MITLYICISILLIILSQIITDYIHGSVGNEPFVRSCRTLLNGISAGILLGLLFKSLINYNIRKEIKSHKIGLP